MTWGSRGAALAAAVVVCTVVNGCAATAPAVRRPAPPRDPGPFPTRAALESLEPVTEPEALRELEIPMVDQWELAGPFPERIGLVPAEYKGGFGAQLVAFARERGGGLLVSADMACFARETGRFLLARGAPPPRGLQRHMAGRCGSPGVRHEVFPFSGEGSPNVTEEQVLAKLKDQYLEVLKKLPAERAAVGVWFGRSGRKMVVTVAVSQLYADLQPVAFAPEADGSVVLTGTLTKPAQRLEGLVTRGRLEFAECKADPAVKLPSFSLRCPSNRADPTAWVSLFTFEPGTVLGTVVSDVLVFPQGKATNGYARPALRAGPDAPEEDGARFAFLLNGLRAELGLKPVAVSEGESRLARKVAPNYFAAAYGKAPRRVADLVALGMLAGWEVEQVTRDAYFTHWVSTGDVSVLLAEMMGSPWARRTLFEPAVRAMAFGAYRLPGGHGMAVMVTTYAPFEDRPQAVEAKKVLDALNRMRAERGLGPAEMVVLPAEIRAELDQALAEGTMDDAVHLVVQRVNGLTGRGVRGGLVETGSLDDLKFPDELLRQPNLTAFITVTHYKPRGLPWGLYVVGIACAAQLGETAALSPTSATSPIWF